MAPRTEAETPHGRGAQPRAPNGARHRLAGHRADGGARLGVAPALPPNEASTLFESVRDAARCLWRRLADARRRLQFVRDRFDRAWANERHAKLRAGRDPHRASEDFHTEHTERHRPWIGVFRDLVRDPHLDSDRREDLATVLHEYDTLWPHQRARPRPSGAGTPSSPTPGTASSTRRPDTAPSSRSCARWWTSPRSRSANVNHSTPSCAGTTNIGNAPAIGREESACSPARQRRAATVSSVQAACGACDRTARRPIAPGRGPERRRTGPCPISPFGGSDHGFESSPERRAAMACTQSGKPRARWR